MKTTEILQCVGSHPERARAVLIYRNHQGMSSSLSRDVTRSMRHTWEGQHEAARPVRFQRRRTGQARGGTGRCAQAAAVSLVGGDPLVRHRELDVIAGSRLAAARRAYPGGDQRFPPHTPGMDGAEEPERRYLRGRPSAGARCAPQTGNLRANPGEYRRDVKMTMCTPRSPAQIAERRGYLEEFLEVLVRSGRRLGKVVVQPVHSAAGRHRSGNSECCADEPPVIERPAPVCSRKYAALEMPDSAPAGNRTPRRRARMSASSPERPRPFPPI